MKKIITVALILSLAGCTAAITPATGESKEEITSSTQAESSTESSEVVEQPDEEAINISFLEDKITVDDNEISEDETSPVYLKKVTETHPDVPTQHKDTENQVVVITRGGKL